MFIGSHDKLCFITEEILCFAFAPNSGFTINQGANALLIHGFWICKNISGFLNDGRSVNFLR
jgi:hypothetical protein